MDEDVEGGTAHDVEWRQQEEAVGSREPEDGFILADHYKRL